ncbi:MULTISPECIES: hypothetical protein [Rhodomicrobium]|uniref:hypothetical protein n=1 Tax=Rhodomicrobium TaxID=1068 RepID=UPI000B4BCE11|nr:MULTISPECIES: hypothetical protein [Rhodomicrobium]
MIKALIRDQIVLTDVYLSRVAERITNQRVRTYRTSGDAKDLAEKRLQKYIKNYEQMENHRSMLQNCLNAAMINSARPSEYSSDLASLAARLAFPHAER